MRRLLKLPFHVLLVGAPLSMLHGGISFKLHVIAAVLHIPGLKKSYRNSSACQPCGAWRPQQQCSATSHPDYTPA